MGANKIEIISSVIDEFGISIEYLTANEGDKCVYGGGLILTPEQAAEYLEAIAEIDCYEIDDSGELWVTAEDEEGYGIKITWEQYHDYNELTPMMATKIVTRYKEAAQAEKWCREMEQTMDGIASALVSITKPQTPNRKLLTPCP